MIKKIKISHLIVISIVLAFVLGVILNTALVLYSMRRQSLWEAQEKARILLDRNLATHTYFSHILKPRLFEWTAPFRDKDYFEPSWMSSTYAIREIHRYFGSLNPNGYSIRDAAINARSPENEADAFERTFLEKLKKDDTLETLSEVRRIDGKPYLTVLRRGETLESSCMTCHADPGKAPGSLVKLYGPERSFHREVGETISAISLRIPLSAAYDGGYRTTFHLSLLLAAVLLLLLAFQFLLYRRLLVLPLGLFRDKALAIAEGREKPGALIQVTAGREIRELAEAFNGMSAQLRRSIDQLEQRVEERTGALNASNEELKREIHEREKIEEMLRQNEQRYRELSLIDDLTQLYNLRYFYQTLKAEMERVERYGHPLTLLILDLDDFKRFNDAYGHIEGDQVLIRLGQVLKRCLRQTDSACRYGGEEFAIIMPMTAVKQGAVTAERIRSEWKEEAFEPLPGREVRLTMSVGLTQYETGEEIKTFVQRVDQHMYRAKKDGKDRVCSES